MVKVNMGNIPGWVFFWHAVCYIFHKFQPTQPKIQTIEADRKIKTRCRRWTTDSER